MMLPTVKANERDELDRAAAIIAECRLLATMTEEPGRITRRFLTPPMAEVHARFRCMMEALGMSVNVDALGNLRAVYSPHSAPQPRLVIGSHIDTVPDAGAFDGVLGVVIAIEWARRAQQAKLPLAIEIIAFSEEEGVRFGVPFLGSRAVAGTFDPALLSLQDAKGISVEKAILDFGIDPSQIEQAAIREQVAGFIEIHIEQGPVLEFEGLPLAIVDGIVGQSRRFFHFTGHANHAGTTPMSLRQDALMAAAEWMLTVEAHAHTIPGLVATVGKITVEPNAGNVIPGHVQVSLDVRHFDDPLRLDAIEVFETAARRIAASRGIAFHSVEVMSQASIPMDSALSDLLLAAVEQAGFPSKRMHSGAGHDAMILAPRIPSAMLFLRSPGGVSHHADETVLVADVNAALEVGHVFLCRVAEQLIKASSMAAASWKEF